MIWFTFKRGILTFTCTVCGKQIGDGSSRFFVHGWTSDEITKMKDPEGFCNRILSLEMKLSDAEVMYVIGDSLDAEPQTLLCAFCMRSHALAIKELLNGPPQTQ